MASSLNSRLLFKREYQEPSQSPYLIKAVEGHYRNCHDTGNYLARTMTVAVHRPANKSPPNRAAEERCSIAAISRTKGGRLHQHVGRTLSYSAILAEWMAELTFAL